MSREQQIIKRLGQKSSEQDGVKTKSGKVTSWSKADRVAVDFTPKGRTSQNGILNRNGKEASNTSGNDKKGWQEKNPELRGACSYMEPRKNGSDKYPEIGIIDLSNANDYEIEITADTNLTFDYIKFDAMEGSKRGNFLVSRALYCMIKVIHNGKKVTMPPGTYWSDGAVPEALTNPVQPKTTGTGQDAVTTKPRHLISCYITRIGVGEEAVTEVHAGLWGQNMNKQP